MLTGHLSRAVPHVSRCSGPPGARVSRSSTRSLQASQGKRQVSFAICDLLVHGSLAGEDRWIFVKDKVPTSVLTKTSCTPGRLTCQAQSQPAVGSPLHDQSPAEAAELTFPSQEDNATVDGSSRYTSQTATGQWQHQNGSLIAGEYQVYTYHCSRCI